MRRIRVSIAQKLILSLGMLVILSFSILVSTHLIKLYHANLRESEMLAGKQARDYTYSLTQKMNKAISVVDTLEATIQQMRRDHSEDRELIVELLQEALSEHPELLGVFTIWEPNAFDGQDALYQNHHLYDDATGRFIPYVLREEDTIRVLPLEDYENAERGSFYGIPKRSKAFTVLEPYIYIVDDKPIMMTSLVMPIIDKTNGFLGVIGVDISLESVQKEIEAVRPLGGYSNIITAQNIYLANGNDSALLMQPYRAWSDAEGLGFLKGNKPKFIYTPDLDRNGTVLRMFHPIVIKDVIWHVETVIPKKNMLSNYFDSLRESIIITLIALLFMTITMILLIRKIILINIQKMVHAISAIALGNSNYKLSIRTNDEFELMANHFNNMIQQRQEAERVIEHQATHDILTGLPNRYAYHRYMEGKAREAVRPEGHYALLFIDLDRFKTINDTMDYAVGDQLLRQVAERIEGVTDNKGKVFRFGGDEFIALLEEVTNIHQAMALAEDILTVISDPIMLKERTFYITASMGMSIHYEVTLSTGDQLVKEADIAMYVAKKERNTCKIYSTSMNDVPKRELILENSMFKALDLDQFMLYYQPKIDLSTGRVFGAEALIRWKHPEFGMVSPLDFIPIAEKTGFIIPLGEWVLQKACQQIGEWERIGLKNLSVSVNMSMIQFQQKQIVHTIERIISDAGIRPEQIELEITESIFMDNPGHTLKILHELKQLGVKLSLDDFGTGFSSLSYLQNIPLHTLKLDKSFINDIVHDFKKQMIFKSVIVIAHNLNLNVVTEGVETEDELRIINEHNCDAVQGYIYSPPVPAPKFVQIFLEHNKNEIK